MTCPAGHTTNAQPLSSADPNPAPQHSAYQQYRDGSDPKWPKKGRPLLGRVARPREGQGGRPGLSVDPRPPKPRGSETCGLRGKLGAHVVSH